MGLFRWIFKLISFASLFSLSSLVIFIISMIMVFLGYIGAIDVHGKAVHFANQLMAKETGLSVEDIEEIEGLKNQK